MKHINIIYRNNFGIAFYWEKGNVENGLTAQVVFRDMGFYLTLDELKSFSYQVAASIAQPTCQNCPNKDDCRSLLLKTPSNKIDLAISRSELYQLQELLDNVIIRVDTQKYMAFALN